MIRRLLLFGFLVALQSVRAQTSTVAFSSATYSGNEGAGSVTITVLRTGDTTTSVAVSFASSDGTAQVGSDYAAANSNLTFAAGQSSASFTVTLLNDELVESNETVNLALSNPTGNATLGGPSTAVLTIVDNDTPTVQFAAQNFEVNESAGTVDITVTRTGGTNAAASVDFAATSGTATAGVDFTSITGTVTFAVGETSTTFTVEITNDTVAELDETANLILSNPIDASLGDDKTATITIHDDEAPTVQFSSDTFSAMEGAGVAKLTVTRLGSTAGDLTIDFVTSDGTATNGEDYLATSGTLNFAEGEGSKTLSVALLDDRVFENNETFFVTLSDPSSNAALGEPSEAEVTIVNDDNQLVEFPDEDGDQVTATLTGHGAMEIALAGGDIGPVDSIVLTETDDSSILTIRVKRAGNGDGLLEIGSITGDGTLRVLNAPACNLSGDLDLAGEIDKLRSVITLHTVEDFTTMNFGSPVGKLTASMIGQSFITAPRIGSIVVKGDKGNDVPGDFLAAVVLTGELNSSNNVTLESLLVRGAINAASVAVDDGNIGRVRCAEMVDSIVTAGYTPANSENPFASGTFLPGLHIGALNVHGDGPAFRNSDVISARFGRAALSGVETNNGGVAYGIFAPENIGAVSVRDPKFHWMRNLGDDVSLGDFHVKQ